MCQTFPNLMQEVNLRFEGLVSPGQRERGPLFWEIFVSVKWVWSIYLNFDEIFDDSSNKWLYRFYDKWKMTFYLHKTKIWMKMKRKRKLSSGAWPGQKGAKINLC